MTTDRIIEVLLAILSLIVGLYAYRLSSKATEAQGKAAQVAVDAGAYERAKEIWESSIDNLREDLASCRSELKVTQEKMAKLNDRLSDVQSELFRIKYQLP